MTMRHDHHVTDTEDAAFDKTMKIMGMAVAVAIAGMAFWYFYA
jgi:hypothetical protein